MNLKINKQILNQLSIIYVATPLLIFLSSWVKSYIAIISVVAFAYAIYISYFKDNNFEVGKLINNRNIVLIILLFSFLWCYLAGLGGFWYQSPDHHWRNAIFRDLINYSWPVYYKTIDAAMIYYIGYWLPSAAFAKLFLFISPMFSFFIGNIFLLVYSVIGVALVFLHILINIKVKKYYKIFLIISLFILFSGMDVVGVAYPIFYKTDFPFIALYLELWSPYVGQYNSNTTILFWVFNQGLPVWLLTLMFYNNRKKIENYGLLSVLCFFCSPIPFIGFSLFVIIYLIKNCFTEYRKNKIIEYLKKFFSFSNIISVLLITPIIILYFVSNKGISGSNGIRMTYPMYVMNLSFVIMIIYFLLLEIIIYLLLIYKQYRKNVIYYISAIFLIFCPFIRIGGGRDFCMRASIPALIIVYLMVTKFIVRKYNLERNKIKYIFLCFCLVLGSCTPIMEFTRGIRDVIYNRTIFRSADDLNTLEGKKGYGKNFITTNPKEKYFFKYLARK